MSEKNSLANALAKGADKAPEAGKNETPKNDEPKGGDAKASEAPKNDEPKVERKPKVEKPKRAPGVYVADGKTVTSRKGLLKSGAPVTPDCFGGGSEAMDRLIDRGVLVEIK